MYEIIDCPHCGYHDTQHHLSYSIGEEFISCRRCGFYTIAKRTNEVGSLPETEVWEFVDEGGGIGCYVVKPKEDDCYIFEPVDDKSIDSLKQSLHLYDYCKYTFMRNKQWYIHDLLTDFEEVFCEWDFWSEGEN
jgi:hypothetical protein